MTTWNPSDKSSLVTLSAGNLTATLNAEPGNVAGVRSTTSKSSGKFVAKVTVNTTGYFTLGVANAGGALTDMPGRNNNAGFCYNVQGAGGSGNQSDFWADSGGVQVVDQGTIANGAAYFLAVDFDSERAWFKPASGGAWNANGAADPDTNAGGNSFSTAAGPYFLFYAGGYNGDGVTVDFAPAGHGLTGFLAWDDAAGASASLTGAAASAARGSLAAGASAGLLGAAAASLQAGSLTAGSPSQGALSGAVAVATIGDPAPHASLAPSGTATTTQAGTLARSTGRGITGAQAACAAGTVAPASPDAPTLVGLMAATAAGGAGGAASAGLAGLAAAGAPGSLLLPGVWTQVEGPARVWSPEAAGAGAWTRLAAGGGSWT